MWYKYLCDPLRATSWEKSQSGIQLQELYAPGFSCLLDVDCRKNQPPQSHRPPPGSIRIAQRPDPLCDFATNGRERDAEKSGNEPTGVGGLLNTEGLLNDAHTLDGRPHCWKSMNSGSDIFLHKSMLMCVVTLHKINVTFG